MPQQFLRRLQLSTEGKVNTSLSKALLHPGHSCLRGGKHGFARSGPWLGHGTDSSTIDVQRAGVITRVLQNLPISRLCASGGAGRTCCLSRLSRERSLRTPACPGPLCILATHSCLRGGAAQGLRGPGNLAVQSLCHPTHLDQGRGCPS